MLTLCVALTFVVGHAADSVSAREERSAVLPDLAERGDWDALHAELSKDLVDQAQPDGMTALHWAVLHDHAESVRVLIGSDADVNATTDYQVTPLSIACERGSAEAAKLLLDAGADANAELPGGQTVLMSAARVGSREIVRELIARGAKVDEKERKSQTALMWAAAAGNAEVVDELLDAGADLEHKLKSGFTALTFAAREGRIEVVARLLEAGADVNEMVKPSSTNGRAPRARMSPLMFAVESGHFELAIFLVKQGADPNDERSGFTPLHALTWVRKPSRGDGVDGDPPPRGSGQLSSLQFVRQIVAAGANVNLQLRKGTGGRAQLNKRGATAFLMAAKTADLPLMKLLHELGADPTLTNVDGCTPLMSVAGIGVKAVGEEAGTIAEVMAGIDWLIDLGADVNAVDDNLETVMHGAAYRLYPQVAIKLAEIGADPKVWNHKNKYGWSPQLIAAGHRPGSFKPSPEMMAAVNEALEMGGGEVVETAPVKRKSEYAK
ncbi:MAG: ankyrin repeat domain-containing protein [Rubripirellula sp.]